MEWKWSRAFDDTDIDFIGFMSRDIDDCQNRIESWKNCLVSDYIT